MTALTSALQSVSLSLNVSRQAEIEMSIRAQLKPLIYAYQRTTKSLEARIWSARLDSAYKVEQILGQAKVFTHRLTVGIAVLLPFALLWAGVFIALHVRVHH
jgi:hypothetical protein